ncbi:MAG: glycosyltransferase family 4 protein [candidate division WOR-3 bacterium]
MNVLLINWRCPKNPLAGGAEVYAYEIFRRLAKKGFKITYLSERANLPDEEEIGGIRFLRRGGKNTFNFTVYRFLPRIVKENNFDLIIDDLNKIPFYSPYFIKEIPVLAILMHLFRKAVYKETSFLFATYVYLAENLIPWVYKDNYFAVLSESTKRDLLNLFKKDISERIRVIPPGIDTQFYQPDFNKKKEKIILHCGRLKRYKSTDHLLLATHLLFQKRRDFRVVIVGDGDDLMRLKKMTKELGMEAVVEFTGYIKEEEKLNLYQSAYFLVENSIKEGWGLIIVEANACGTPVIAARSPGLVDAVREGKTGLFYQYGDIKELSEKMAFLLDNEEMVDRMGKEGRMWAEKFSWEESAQKMEDLIRLVLAKR